MASPQFAIASDLIKFKEAVFWIILERGRLSVIKGAEMKHRVGPNLESGT